MAENKKQICSSAYRCIDVVVKEYFALKYQTMVREKAVNYFLDKYLSEKGDITKRSSTSLSKTIEQLLIYSHRIKKKDYHEIDWEKSDDQDSLWW